MPKVSVLVPVYNSVRYLPQSLDSLLRQTLTDIEIICIDDASTDGSLAMLNDYARRDGRIKVLHQEHNTGQAHARNYGLQHSTGDYIAFLDSDDWISDDCLEQAVRTLDTFPLTDCVLLHVRYYYPDSDTYTDYNMQSFLRLSGREAFELSLDWSIHGWYVARRSLYERDPYDESCHSYSDDNTTRLHYYNSREVRTCDGVFYYRCNPDSVTHKVSLHRFDYMLANESMKRHLQRLGVGEPLMCKYETIRLLVLVDSYMVYHCHGSDLSAAERRQVLSEMRRVRSTLERHRLDPRVSRKFGYMVMPSWWLFRAQEWLYFTLRSLLRKNK